MKADSARNKKLQKQNITFKEPVKAYSKFGSIFLKKENYDKAIEWYSKALELAPNNAALYHNMGVVYFHKKDYVKAMEWFKKTLELNAEYTYTYYAIGCVYRAKGDNDKGLEYQNKAKALCQNLASDYEAKGEYDKAIECYKTYAEIAPENRLVTYNNIGLLYDKIGSRYPAKDYFKKAIELSDFSGCCFMAINCAHGKNYDRVIEWYAKALELEPNSALAYHKMGDAYFIKEKHDNAIECYKNAIENYQNGLDLDYSDWVLAYYNIAVAYYKKENYNKAIENFEKFIELKPDAAEAYYAIGDIYAEKGDNKNATKYKNKARNLGYEP